MKPWLITPERLTSEQIGLLDHFFDRGLERLHLRLPGAGEEDYSQVIEAVAACYRRRVVVHDHPRLVGRYGLCGLHLPERVWKGMTDRPQLPDGCTVSASCHTIEDIESFPFRIDYCFLSPIFDSLCKVGYAGRFSSDSLGDRLQRLHLPVVALGGITPDRLPQLRRAGFASAAALGYVWLVEGWELMRWQELCTPAVICVGGVDPSAGAGITADVRTAENMGVRAYTVATAITFQGSGSYRGERWVDSADIIRQIETLSAEMEPAVAKIGLIRDSDTLSLVVDCLKKVFPSIRIVWDPVLRASADNSAGQADRFNLEDITALSRIDFITPNLPEARHLLGCEPDDETLLDFYRRSGVGLVLKGGHAGESVVTDRIVYDDRCEALRLLRGGTEKHGTGCAHSTAFAAALALEQEPFTAAGMAQLYVSRLRERASGLLAMHKDLPVDPVVRLMSEIDLQFITHRQPDLSELEEAEAVCRMGVRWVQLRMKEASDEEMLHTACAVKAVCRHYGSLFVVNDRVAIARQVDADGVHLGQEDMEIVEARRILGSNKIIGCTCNTMEDVRRAYGEGADYVGIGPYRYTETKQRLAPVLGLEGYKSIAACMQTEGIRLPAFAIGGIEDADIPLIRDCGIGGIAVSGSLIRKIKKN